MTDVDATQFEQKKRIEANAASIFRMVRDASALDTEMLRAIDWKLIEVVGSLKGFGVTDGGTEGECAECGATPALVGCPDGSQICQRCFDAGLH